MTVTERIERYIAACPAAISGQSGHNVTFKVAIALIRGFNLSERKHYRSCGATTCDANHRGAIASSDTNSVARPIFNPNRAAA